MTYWAIILAAGESKRMGTPKPFLKLRGKTFVERIYNSVKDSGVEKTVIVFGVSHKGLARNLKLPDALVVWNNRVERGQLYSLKLALRRIPTHVDGALVCLVDHPCVRKSTYKALLRHAQRNPGSIIIPVHGGERGHPVVFPRSLFRALREASLEFGARKVVNEFANCVIEWQTRDATILLDVDTPEVYKSIAAK